MAMAAATAAAVVGGGLIAARGIPGVPHHLVSEAAGSSAGASKGGIEPDSPHKDAALDDGLSDEEDYEKDGDDVEEAETSQAARGSGASKHTSRKLWSKQQFPEGTDGAANFTLANLRAAQDWECPCKDRKSCISSDRVDILALYDHRRTFRTTAAQHGGLRDANRSQLEAHYDRSSRIFTRSFVVCDRGDCCAPSAALANGISFATFGNSRTDVIKGRPWHGGRCELRSKQETEERAHLESYIRSLRGTMEGPKGGSQPKDKYYLPKAAVKARWDTYVEHRRKAGLSVIGSLSLFAKLWRAHTEIVEFGAKGHAKCDTCGEIEVERERYKGRPDKLAECDARKVCTASCPMPKPHMYTHTCTHAHTHTHIHTHTHLYHDLYPPHAQAAHDANHRGERDYAEDIWFKAEHHPSRVTAFSMDAPTETQFDVPVQQRTAYDPVKSLDTAKKWSSKITGLMMAGMGMLAFVSRDGLGSGPNLSCTVLYLSLLHVASRTGHGVHTMPRQPRKPCQPHQPHQHMVQGPGCHWR